jgi:hypothetical protein
VSFSATSPVRAGDSVMVAEVITPEVVSVVPTHDLPGDTAFRELRS